METIFHQVWIKADKEKIFEALTTQKGLSDWWGNAGETKLETGFVIEFHHSTKIEMKITEFIPGKYLAWECISKIDSPDNPGSEWFGTKISFRLQQKNGFINLNFRHSRWVSQSEFFGVCNYHWARHLSILKHLCETGISLLEPENEKKQQEAVIKGKV
jgi:uncharacterized protein YndB with AHSA1/START domain